MPVQAVRDGVYMVKCWRIRYRRGRHRDCLKTFADDAERAGVDGDACLRYHPY